MLSLSLSLSPSLYPFFSEMLLSLYTQLSTSIPISKSTLPLGLNPHHRSQAPIHNSDQASTDLPSSDPLAPIHSSEPQVLIHSSDQASIDLPSSNPQAPVSLAPIHKHWSVSVSP